VSFNFSFKLKKQNQIRFGVYSRLAMPRTVASRIDHRAPIGEHQSENIGVSANYDRSNVKYVTGASPFGPLTTQLLCLLKKKK
jgi:hypothetical protein